MKIEKAIEEFLLYSENERELSSRTIKAYRIDLNQFKLFLEANNVKFLKNIDKSVLERYSIHISNAKPKTIKRKFTVIIILWRCVLSQLN